jgi:hypothetical protein
MTKYKQKRANPGKDDALGKKETNKINPKRKINSKGESINHE